MIDVPNGSGRTQIPETEDGALIDCAPLGFGSPHDTQTMPAIPDHDETAHRNVICSLVALEIVDYSAKPVFDQIRLTQDFRQLLVDATAHAAPDEFVCTLREDGALLVFLADPGECFTSALTIRDATLTQRRYHDLSLRVGINLGMAQIAEDEFGNPYVGGEGRQDADRIMRQGPPRQISVSRQFVELLSRAAPELAGMLEYQGVYSDTVDPPLRLYRLSPRQVPRLETLSNQTAAIAAPSRAIASPRQPILAPIVLPTHSTAQSQHESRRLWLGLALLPLLAGAAMWTLSGRLSSVQGPGLTPAAQLGAAPSGTTAPEALEHSPKSVASQDMIRPTVTTPAVLSNDAKIPPPGASLRAKSRQEVAPATADGRVELGRTAGAHASTKAPSVQGPRSATLSLAVKPWGEVYVDGRKIGVTPPLKKFALAPGLRLITITNSSLPTYQAQLAVDPGAQLTVAHDFICISDREKPCREGFGKGLELHSRFTLETADAQR